ncbi:hypothetical protein [Phytohabitans aurantiacus]|uniref:Uncharacterized protein n=1 Tax=Phytohabitans aurantiacus TaxID=3016789 RepID=A0ABQ5R0G0_9ACTN|nr:hypothetical protein [Phytohabitans aurantiacus]GLI00299.1 hypothetical protein Pa4123_55750 [Phytohabitans aurantiacus]
MDETLVELLLDLMNASFEQGRAVERNDPDAARRHQRSSMYAFQNVLEAAKVGKFSPPAEPGS